MVHSEVKRFKRVAGLKAASRRENRQRSTTGSRSTAELAVLRSQCRQHCGEPTELTEHTQAQPQIGRALGALGPTLRWSRSWQRLLSSATFVSYSAITVTGQSISALFTHRTGQGWHNACAPSS